MAKRFIREIKPYARLYRDGKTGIAWIEDGSTGCGHSCHSSIDATGSIKGMKQLGYWRKRDRIVRSHGWYYNIDTFIEVDDLDRVVAKECNCEACLERRAKHDKTTRKNYKGN